MDEFNKAVEAMAPQADKRLTVEETIDKFEEYRLSTGAIEKSSYQSDMCNVRNYINPYLGEYIFAEVDRVDITNWLNEIEEKLKK